MTSPEAMSAQILRIIDANLNRLGEGLRFLEEIARFMLNDAGLTQQLKTMRHELIRGDRAWNQQLLQSRNASGDVGVALEVAGEEKEKELPLVLVANARRAQESLRTLEELAKLPGMAGRLEPEKFQQARFELYTIEQKLLSRLLRQEKRKHIAGLYVIIDTEALKGRQHLEVASQVIQGGARIIQLRDKIQNKEKVLAVARQLKALCSEHEVLFIMNDYLDIALAADADGLHVGQDDLPVPIARKLLPLDKILGCSTTTVEQATQAQSEGADYIAVGAMYPTSSKTSTTTPAVTVGLERLRQIRQAVSLPMVAIGGISQDNAAEVISAGADSLAVIGAIVGAASPQEAARRIAGKFEIAK